MAGNKTSFFLCLALVLYLFGACQKKEDPGIYQEYKYEYFPLEKGYWIIYDVDSTAYNDIDTPAIVTKASYQLKEIVESSFRDAEGRLNYRLERWRRNLTDSIWQPYNACYAYTTVSTAEKVEDNLRFIKLVFPAIVNKKWYGNTYMNAKDELAWYGGWEYEYTAVYQPVSVNTLNFDSSLTVMQINDTLKDLTKMKYAQEIYAKNVGMVYKKVMKLETQQFSSAPWEQKAQKGFIIEMKAADYNK